MTDRFIGDILNLNRHSWPQSAVSAARECLADYFGCYVAGAADYRRVIENLMADGVCNLQLDALVNGIKAHAIELDDGHRYGMMHPGAPVISALLPVAEKEKLGADDFLQGVLVGYEVAIRLACTVQPGCKLRGFHATGTCGTIGAAMAIAAALHFDKDQMKSAFSAAVTSAAGVLEMIAGDSQLKPYNAGRAAMDGLTAAYVGRAGFRPPADALGGKRGFLAIMTDSPKLEYLDGLPNGTAAIETIYRKPYAACRHCHAPIEAALNIAQHPDFRIANVKRVFVDTYKLAVAGHEHREIEGVNSAKMSIPYSVAVGLLKKNGGMGSFTQEAILDNQVIELAKRVVVRDCDEFTALCPGKRIAVVTVKMKDGTEFKERVDYPKGEPENPLTPVEVEAKFRDLVKYAGMSNERAEMILEEIRKNNFDICKIVEMALNK